MRLFAWLAIGEWRAQPIRNALSVAAIAIGVALGFAVHLVNAVALDRFSAGINRSRGMADLQIVANGANGFDEEVYARLMADDGPVARLNGAIADTSPVVERDVGLRDAEGIVLRISGIDAMRAVAVTPMQVGQPTRSANQRDDEDLPIRAIDWLDDEVIYLPQPLLDRLGKRARDRITIDVDGRAVPLRIVGRLFGADADDARSITSPDGKGPALYRATMDIAGAQWHLDRLGRLSRIDLRLAEGADTDRVRDVVAAVLPPSARITTANDDQARTGDLSRAYRVNLDMLALMALFTGAFLVYSTQTLAVARRRAQLALLRVLGVKQRRMIGQVVAEGLLQGVVGGALGLALGTGIAAAMLRTFGGDLGGGYFSRASLDWTGVLASAPAAGLFFALGLVAALVGSVLPARAAAREAPARVLKSSGSDVLQRAPRAWTAGALLAAGIACAFAPSIEGLPIAGYVSMALLLFGGIAAMPWVACHLLAPLARSGRAWSPAIDLAIRRLWAAPSAASVALCGLVASASLMVAMTVMIASFRHSVDAWLGEVLSADLYLRTNAVGDAGLTSDDIVALSKVEGVAALDVQKVVPVSLAPSRPAVSVIARTIDDDPRRSLPLLDGTSIAVPAGATPVWVSEAVVDLYGAKPGQAIALPLGDVGTSEAPRVVVAGVWRDYARQFGSIAIRRDDYVRITHDERFGSVSARLAPQASSEAVAERLRHALPASLQEKAEVFAPSEIRALSLSIFDRSFAVTYVLQAVAIVIGLAGIAATFSAQTLARAREFGMLRHIGVRRRQIVDELAAEGALLGVIGAVAGGMLGMAMSQILIHVVNPQSFHWTMDTSVPWITLTIVAIALIAASAGTAVLSGRRALTRDAVLAVREDW